jgi:hypothetical protein
MLGKVVIASVLLASGLVAPAYAQHDHDHAADDHHGHTDAPATISGGVALVAATFDTMFYFGSYAGILPSARWASARYAVIASGSVYRITKNGADHVGLGDASVHGQAILLSAGGFDAGLLGGVSLPTGEPRHGLGMGHAMLMPGVFATWAVDRLRLSASVGYSRALGEGHHDHGAWPLVSPMLVSEVSWTTSADVRVTDKVSAGVRASGGLPAGEGGSARAVVASRVAWRTGRAETGAEVGAGLVGDPFTVRGMVSTMLRF